MKRCAGAGILIASVAGLFIGAVLAEAKQREKDSPVERLGPAGMPASRPAATGPARAGSHPSSE